MIKCRRIKFEWDNNEYALTDDAVKFYTIMATIDYRISKEETVIDEVQLDIMEGNKFVFKDMTSKDEYNAIYDEAWKRAEDYIFLGDL